MTSQDIINQLSKNQFVFEALLKAVTHEQAVWKPESTKWSMLEVVCHLVDEEKFDFRTRVRSVLVDPIQELPTFNPLDWVTKHSYSKQDIRIKTNEFLEERVNSIKWLKSLNHPQWQNVHLHPTLGPMSALSFLTNWLAHDYIHLRQINRLSYEFLKFHTGVELSYAGKW